MVRDLLPACAKTPKGKSQEKQLGQTQAKLVRRSAKTMRSGVVNIDIQESHGALTNDIRNLLDLHS